MPRWADETCSTPCAAGREVEKPSGVLLQRKGHISVSGSAFQELPFVNTHSAAGPNKRNPAFPAHPCSLAVSCSTERLCKARGVWGRRLEWVVFTSWCE